MRGAYVQPMRRRRDRRRREGWVDCCDGKVRYRDRMTAKHAAMLIRNAGGALRPYPCTFCRGWHLTSQESRREGAHGEGGLQDGAPVTGGQPADRVEDVG